MALLGSLSTVFGLAIALPVDSVIKSRAINRKVSEMVARGSFIPTEWQVDLRIARDVANDWTSGERKHFPKEIIPFFEENSYALERYQKAMTMQLTIEAGYKPAGVPDITFTGGVWNAFTWYEQECGAEERAWLQKHRPDIYDEIMRRQDELEKFEKKQKEEREQAGKKQESKFYWGLGITVLVLLVIMGLIDIETMWLFIKFFGGLTVIGLILMALKG